MAQTTPLTDLDRPLVSSPIGASDVVDGQPDAHVREVDGRRGGLRAGHWTCTRGSFYWHYATDEAIQLLKGEVVLTGPEGQVRRLLPGDAHMFTKGTTWRWEILADVHKFWVLPGLRMDPVSRVLRRARHLAARRAERRTGGSAGLGT